MVEFNLCSWREQRDSHQRRQTIKALVLCLLSLLIMFGAMHVWLYGKINDEKNGLQVLNHQLLPFVAFKEWEAEQRKNATSVANADRLRQGNWQLMRLLQAMSEGELSAACLTGLSYSQHQLTLTGKTMSSSMLMLFLKQWGAVRFLNDIKVTSLVFDHAIQQLNFQLQTKTEK